jgi:5-methyltetrahydropteroyltriglutamate--homocysteine methyltransferase
MELILANTGSYPRIGDTPDQQRLRRAHAQREQGELTPEQFAKIQDDVTAEVVREQIAAGIELPTDGQIRWADGLSHLAANLNGASVNGLLRYFDTNTYFRQPVVSGRISRKAPLFAREYRHAAKVAGRPLKAVVTGPYTMARGTILQGGYRSLHALSLAYAAVIGQEIAELAAAGAPVIQVDEPAILRHPSDLVVLGEALVVLARGKGTARLSLATYFGDVSPLYDEFQNAAVDILHVDLTYSAKLARLIADRGSGKLLSLGLVDARNTRLETKETVFPVLDLIARRLRGPVHLAPSAGLEYLPRDRARAKLETMRRLRDAYVGDRR